jgi:putative redox protein
MRMSKSNEHYPVKVNWVKHSQFIASDDRGHVVVLDTSLESGGGGSGPSPGRLLLMAVAGCTAIDVVDILKKSRQKLSGLEVQSGGIQESDYPKYYKEIHLKYVLRGTNLEKSRVERAIKLSEDKYCSVGATLKGKAKIITSYEIANE